MNAYRHEVHPAAEDAVEDEHEQSLIVNGLNGNCNVHSQEETARELANTTNNRPFPGGQHGYKRRRPGPRQRTL